MSRLDIYMLTESNRSHSASRLTFILPLNSHVIGRIRYNQNYRGRGRGMGRGNGRGGRWGGYFIFLGNLTQIQVYFQHLLKISSDATCLFRSHSLLSIKVIFRAYLKTRISEIVDSLEK